MKPSDIFVLFDQDKHEIVEHDVALNEMLFGCAEMLIIVEESGGVFTGCEEDTLEGLPVELASVKKWRANNPDLYISAIAGSEKTYSAKCYLTDLVDPVQTHGLANVVKLK